MKKVIISAIFLILNGCTMAGLVKISDPSINNPSYTFSSGILKLQDIEVSIKPETYKNSLIFGGIIFPVIPLGFGNDFNRQEHNLKVIIQFDPNNRKLSFSPEKTFLLINGKKIAPEGYSKALTSIEFARETDKAPPGHKWRCRDMHEVPTVPQTNIPLVLKQETCVVLEYPIITPKTSEKFNISIEGLKKGNIPVEVPSFHFESGTTGVFTILG